MAQVQRKMMYNDNPISKSKKFLDSMEKEPKYAWDWSVPKTDFWQNLTAHDARAIQNIIPAQQVEDMKLDAHLARREKLEIFLTHIQDGFQQKEKESAPKLFHEADYKGWSTFVNSITLLLHGLDRLEECEQYALWLIMVPNPDSASSAGPDGRLGLLAEVRVAQGRFEEAEKLSRRSLEFLEGHPKCGRESPMAFGSRRAIIETVWKQDKHEEAEKDAEELRKLIEGSREGKFGKYAGEELDGLNAMMEELKVWKP